MKMGEILIEEGLINHLQLKEAIRKQSMETEKKLGEILIEMGFISVDELETILMKQVEELKLTF